MIGQKVSHYRILQKLGGGGMGVVYEAEDLRLGRHVALKFVPDNLIGDRKFLDRFEREARAASLLNHPNICTIHDIEDNKGHPFIVMEKLEGQSLKERLHGSHLDLETLLDTAVQVADALAASHAKGILHRDIKPANIYLMPNGQVKVLDFGLAKLLKNGAPGMAEDTPADDSLTAVGVIPGTAVYMSPEQARSEELDARSDLFSFGVVLYEMATGKKPFHGKNIVTTLEAVMNQKPIAPRQVNPRIPAELEAIIGKAMEKDRQKRYASAEAMKADLQKVKRDTESALTKGGKPKSAAREISALQLVNTTFQTSTRNQKYLLLGMAGLLLAVLAAVGTWWLKHRLAPADAGQNTIAVLPLRNMSGDSNVDYLRFALADEVANVLTYTRLLDVRPSSVTRKYADAEIDPRRVGRELHVGTLLTGHFLRQGNRLLITLEAIDADSDKLLWQSNINAAVNNLTSLQRQLGNEMRQGLLPVLGASGGYLETGTQPQNAEAYDLYLRSIAVPHDPGPNKEAISALERAVKMDASYAPAWEALGQRYYYDATYSNGGDAAFQKSNAAYEHALALDPNRVFAASNLIANRVERGEVAKAYASAQALVKQRPDSAEAHFALAYVLRYAGMLEEATQQCDAALRLDPGNYHLRSCAFAFMELGKTQRAMDFVRLDLGSEWSNWVAPAILLREGKTGPARERARQMPSGPAYHREFLQACLQSPPTANMDQLTKQTETAAMAQPDPEAWYLEGSIMAFCGQDASALRLLKAAVQQNYCAYSALLSDPLLARLRKVRDFDAVLTAGHNCQNAVRNPQAP